MYRREAMGAFAHEIRTPLTSIRMVLELARRQSEGGELVLDEELASMLATSVDDLQHLADDLQESSRLERGKLSVSPGPSDFSAAVEAARTLVAAHIAIEGEAPQFEGPWDASRLVRAVAGFAETANRIGNGSGTVHLEADAAANGLLFTISSGAPNDAWRPIASDAGFAYFRSRQFILAMGGAVECIRGERYCCLRVHLPR